ncbi:MAG TPA: PAS domain-containing protein [Gemmatimonadaceae bacterium]|nr:PAS domain-containing protein [Gemmatimonadaceae bacterium]
MAALGGPSDAATRTFVGDGEMQTRCRALDWSATPLGPVDGWPSALGTAVRTCLESPFPTCLWCGAAAALVYNDAYRRVLGAKHPRALGRPGAEVWAEIWDDIAPMFASMRAGGPSVYLEDAPFVVQRAGGREDVWFTYSLSAVRDDAGTIVAFLNVVSETTSRILGERELVAARAAAERAGARLREVFALAPAFLAVLRGEQHVFEYVNDAYLRLVGQRDIAGKPLAEALPEVRAQGFVELLDDVRATGTPFVGHERLVKLARSPGAPLEERFVDFVYQPLQESNGVTRIVAHGSDVTEQVRARRDVQRLLAASERARQDLQAANAQLEAQAAELAAVNRQLQESAAELEERTEAAEHERRRVERVFDSISDAFFTVDRDWRFTYVNDRAQQVLARRREELLGRNLWQEFGAARGSAFEREYHHAMATRTPVVFEEHYAPLDLRVEVRAYPSDEGLAVYFQDITGRHRAVRALAESEARFRAVQDVSPDASLLARAVRDAEGRIVDFLFTYANEAAQRILMGGPEPVVGRTMREAFPESVVAGRLDVYARVVETGETWQQDVYYRRGPVEHGLRATAVKVGDGMHLGAIDLSERIRAEAEREQLLAEAERARAEAEEANRAKSQFLTTMSHELRTPLNAIGGYADLLLMGVRGELAAAQRQDVERMRRSGQHLLVLINDILNFARLEAGQVELHVRDLPVATLLDGLEDLIRPQVAARSIRYRHGGCDAALRMRADAERTRQILLNLLANAVKFTAPGGEVSLACEAAAERVFVHVHDSGRGIPADQLERVFDPFVQVDRQLTPTSQQGVGLGLAISRDLAASMGGTLSVVSTVGVGSTFTLALPRAI